MKDVVTVQGKTVEEAIAVALERLAVSKEEVDIEVLASPSRRLLGFRKELAEVKVTRKEVPNEDEVNLEALVDAVIEEGSVKSLGQDDSVGSRVRLKEGQLEFDFQEGSHPVLIPSDGVQLIVNGMKKEMRVAIQPDDDVKLSVADEDIPPKFTIQLQEEKMIALLTFTPGKKIHRVLKESDYTAELHILTSEESEYYNDLSPQVIIERMKELGVQQGIIFPAIQKVIQAKEPFELVIARGVSPEEGHDGDLDIHIDLDDAFTFEGSERVDFREMHQVTSVKEEEIIATHQLPIPGKEGYNLLGHKVPAKNVQDITLHLGGNVTQVGQDIIAKVGGNPVVDRRKKVVKISVNPELYHPGDVDIESGNIRSEGDIRIGKNVLASMYVGASGSIIVEGAVTKAKIEAMRSITIRGNILSSTITVGRQDLLIQDLIVQLEAIGDILRQIKQAIDQVLIVHKRETPLTDIEQHRFIQLFLEKKNLNLKQLITDFIGSVKKDQAQLPEEWEEIVKVLHKQFVLPTQQGEMDLPLLIGKIDALITDYQFETLPTGQLIVPYAVNSQLYCHGNIQVLDKGVFQSTLIAKDSIHIQGVCRGGEIIAENNITLQETGSENPVTTIVKTNGAGRIRIGKAYAGTEIQIGNRKHVCVRDEYEVHARLDQHGELMLR